MKAVARFVLAALCSAMAMAQQAGLVGELPAGETRWAGQVRLDGDVTVPAAGKLVIAPGTVVTIAPRDSARSGWNGDQVELHVKGQLLVEGRVDAPVVFVPDDGGGRDVGEPTTIWHGLVLHARSDAAARRNIVRGAQFFRAFVGLQEPAGEALVEDCVFVACSEGIEVGAAYRDDRYHGVPGGEAAPEIRRCRFVGCHTGIYTERGARPHVEDCVFARVVTGVGASRPVFVNWQDRPGPRVVGCAFVDAQRGVFGCAVVRESWFLRCGAALSLSSYHDAWATSIEPVVLERILVEDVPRIATGDTGVVREALRGTVRPSGDLAELLLPWPPLPTCLRLADDSDGKGRGFGGRDLGPMGTGAGAEPPPELPWEGPVLRGWLAAPVDRPRDLKKLTAVQPGLKVGTSWWAVADADEYGVVHLKGAFGVQRVGGLLGLSFETASAGKVSVPWTGDVAEFAGWLDGRLVVERSSRCRFGVEQPPMILDCSAGHHLLLLHVNGWGVDPKFGLGTVAGWQVTKPEATKDGQALALRARVQGRGKTRTVEVDPAAAVHWRMRPGMDAVELRDATGTTFGISWEWTATGVLRLRPAVEAPAGKDLRLVWVGLRDLLGQPLVVEPTPVRLP
jgi:hypothetical protein